MNGNGYFLGIVHNGAFDLLEPDPGPISVPIRLTGISMQESVPPESKELDLTEYEGKAIMVRGHSSGGWIYSAEVIDQAGPILTAVVQRVFAKQAV